MKCIIFTWFIKIKGFEPRLITPQIDDKIVVLVVTILSLPPPTPHGVPGYKERQEVICQKKILLRNIKIHIWIKIIVIEWVIIVCLRDKTNQSIYDSYKNYFNIDTFYKELEIRARVHKDFQQRHFVKVFKIKSLSARFSK